MNKFEQGLTKYFSLADLEKIQQVQVGIGGAGGLGGNCACHLVRCGFKRLVIADYDVVDYSNLNRQFYFLHQVGQLKVEALADNLRAINPDVQVITVAGRLDQARMAEVFAHCQAVVEAFDDVIYKRMMVETFLPTDKLLVAASGIGGFGQSDDIRVRQVKKNFYLVGDMVSGVGADCPPLSPRVNIVAAKQADVVLSWVLGQ